jgi:DNA-binding NtrC family response regulator
VNRSAPLLAVRMRNPETNAVERLPYRKLRLFLQAAVLRLAGEANHNIEARTAQALGVVPSTVRRLQSQVAPHLTPTPPQEVLEAFYAAARALLTDCPNYHELMARFDRELAAAAVEEAGGNYCGAARLLKIHRNTIWKLAKRRGA